MIAYASLYLLSGAIFLTASLWVAGDLDEGKRATITPRMLAVALAWPAALLWLIGAAAVDVVQHLRGR